MQTNKKSFYKRWRFFAYTFMAIIIIGIFFADPSEEKMQATPKVSVTVDNPEAGTPKELKPVSDGASKPRDIELKEIAEAYVNELSGVEFSNIVVNNDMGSGEAGNYIVLANLTLTNRYKAGGTQSIMDLHSGRLANEYTDDTDVSAVKVFWEIPHHGDGNLAKYRFEREYEVVSFKNAWYDSAILN